MNRTPTMGVGVRLSIYFVYKILINCEARDIDR